MVAIRCPNRRASGASRTSRQDPFELSLVSKGRLRLVPFRDTCHWRDDWFVYPNPHGRAARVRRKPYIKVFAAITALASVIGIVALVRSGSILPDLGRTSISSTTASPALSAPSPSLSLTPPLATSDAGWILSESRDPFDDSRNVVLTVSAASGKTRFGDAPDLVLRCSRKKTEAYINWNDFMGTEPADVTIRVGHGRPSQMSWSLSTDNKATFYPESAVSLIKSLLDSDTLVARATPYEESPITAVFAVTGLSSKITSLEAACGWH